MAHPEFAPVLPSALHRLLPQATDGKRGAALSGAGEAGGPGSPEHPDRTKPAPGGAHHEEVLMREETSCGGQKERLCPRTMVEPLKSAGMRY